MSLRSRRHSQIDPIDTVQVFASDGQSDTTLLDLLDNLLNNGVVLQGELVLGVANVDLIYAELSVLLSAADRVLGPQPTRRVTQRARGRSRPPR